MTVQETLNYFDKTLSDYLLINGKIFTRHKAIIHLINHEDDQDGYEI